MKVFVIVASLIAVSLAAPSIYPGNEEMKSPPSAVELLMMKKEFQLAQMVLMQMSPEEIRMLVFLSSQMSSSSKSPEGSYMPNSTGNDMTPLEQLKSMKEEKFNRELMKEEKMLELELLKEEKMMELKKNEDMLQRKRYELMMELKMLEEETMLYLKKDEAGKSFDFKKAQLTPMLELILKKEQTLLGLNKEEDLFKYKQQETPKEKLIESLF